MFICSDEESRLRIGREICIESRLQIIILASTHGGKRVSE